MALRSPLVSFERAHAQARCAARMELLTSIRNRHTCGFRTSDALAACSAPTERRRARHATKPSRDRKGRGGACRYRVSNLNGASQKLRQSQRVCLSRDFDRAMRRGKARRDRFLIVRVVPNGLSWSRLGLAVGRRVGNAVKRHAVKRRIREAFRVSRDALPSGFDIICVALVPAANGGARLRSSLIELARRASATA